MSTDAIVLLKKDHQDVRQQFRAFRKPDQTAAQKQDIVDTILELLTVHTYIENEVM
ncbi:MAG: hemerythrin, partial [Humibacillus sp.]|nr:hemerythrin [Humibacillus sp.]